MAKTLNDLITEKFGVSTQFKINPLVNQLGTSKEKILNNNPNRIAYVLINLSPNSIYVLPDEEVSESRAIKILGGGSKFSMNYETDFHLVGVGLYGFAEVDASQIMVLEILTT